MSIYQGNKKVSSSFNPTALTETNLKLDTHISNKPIHTTQLEKDKLESIATGANNYIHPVSHPASMISGLPSSLPANGGNAATVGGFTVGVNVPTNAKFTDTVYVHPNDASTRHVTDSEKTTWNGKANKLDTTALLTHAKSGIIHTLTGTAPTSGFYTARFKATADFAEGNSFTLNGIAFAAQDSLGEEIAGFKSGAVVGIEIDVAGKKLNFKSGGGGGASAQLPSPLTSFSASAGNAQATYTLGYDATDTALSGIFLVRKVASMPMSLSDGVKLDVGKVTTYTDKGLVNGTTYYVRAFPYNSKKQVQNALDNAVVSFEPSEGLRLVDLPVGSLVVDLNTKYYDAPIVWKIADQNHGGYPANSTTLIADKILTLKCFDAAEPANSDAGRKSNGNNRHIHSNLLAWLNSNANVGAWYAAKHSADAPPNGTNASGNPYDTQAGFLSTFGSDFLNALLTTTLTVARNTVTDGGSYETLTDKLFLAGNTEVGLANENNIVEGAKLALFTDNASRIATLTAEAVSNGGSGSAGDAWYWWLRTPYAPHSYDAHIAYSDGTLNGNSVFYGNGGVRPLCNIPNTTRVSLAPNAQGQYEILF